MLISMNIIKVCTHTPCRGLGLGLGGAQADWSIRGCSTAGGCAAVFLAIAGFINFSDVLFIRFGYPGRPRPSMNLDN